MYTQQEVSRHKTKTQSRRRNSRTTKYLETLKGVDLDRIYSCPWSCQGVLQSLPTLAKNYVTRIAALSGPIKVSQIKSWVQGGMGSSHEKALQKLFNLRILTEIGRDGDDGDEDIVLLDLADDKEVSVNPVFGSLLKGCLQDGLSLPWQKDAAGNKIAASKVPPSLHDIERDAREQWNILLHFVVGSDEKRPPPTNIQRLLVEMGLMAPMKDSDDLTAVLSNEGYEFMLMDLHQQIWILLRFYTERSKNPHEVIQFLFRLSFCKPGTVCSFTALTPGQRDLAGDFRKFGLLYFKDQEVVNRFYPTQIGVSVVFGETREHRIKAATIARDTLETSQETAEDLAVKVIVETNFKVYAYTESKLHQEMLRLFVEVETLLPNLLVGVIKRESVRDALKKGISAKQKNAHPLCQRRALIVPDNVTDQILLWELERQRIKKTMCRLYSNFESEEEFAQALQYASDMGILLWHNKHDQRMAVQDHHNPTMRAYFESKRREAKG